MSVVVVSTRSIAQDGYRVVNVLWAWHTVAEM